MNTIYAANRVVWGPAKLILPSKGHNMVNATVWDKFFKDGSFLDKDFVRKKYLEHYEEVKATIPEDKLLVFSVKEGWEPLCKFLEKPVPNIPFPHKNDTAEFRKMISSYRNTVLGINVAVFATAALVIGAGGYFFYNSRK